MDYLRECKRRIRQREQRQKSVNQVQNIVKEELKFISIDNSFEEFYCKGFSRNRSSRKESHIKNFSKTAAVAHGESHGDAVKRET